MTGDTNSVLVADGDPGVVAQFRSWLADDYRVEATTDGDDALAVLEDVDAALVDRNLRTASGTVVATEIERREDAQTVAILCSGAEKFESRSTGGETLVKPVAEREAFETVDRLLRRNRYDELMDECAALAAKRGALEARSSSNEPLESAEDWTPLQRRLDEVFTELDDLVGTFDGDDFRAAFARCKFGNRSRPQQGRELS